MRTDSLAYWWILLTFYWILEKSPLDLGATGLLFALLALLAIGLPFALLALLAIGVSLPSCPILLGLIGPIGVLTGAVPIVSRWAMAWSKRKNRWACCGRCSCR